MASKWLMYLLVAEYAGLITTNAFEGNYHKSMYWFGAVIINVSILLIK